MRELFDKRMKQLHSDISSSYSSLNVSLFAFDCIGEPQSEDGKATVDMLRKIKAEQLKTMQFLCDIMNPLDRLLEILPEWNRQEAEADLGEIEHKGEKVTVKIKVVRGSEMKFERIVAMTPAFDKRHPDPTKNYGIGGVEIAFFLKGERGAVQFKIGTGWFLPENRKPGISDDYPMARDKGYHSYIPQYDSQTPITDSCHVLDGKPCYYDDSTLNAEPLLDVLLREGSDGIWRELEQYYKETFHPGKFKEPK